MIEATCRNFEIQTLAFLCVLCDSSVSSVLKSTL